MCFVLAGYDGEVAQGFGLAYLRVEFIESLEEVGYQGLVVGH